MSFSKLFIYDAGDEDNRKQAEGRFSALRRWTGTFDPGITPLPCYSPDDVDAGLGQLKKKGLMFNKVFVLTHGHPGALHFFDPDTRKGYVTRLQPLKEDFWISTIQGKGYDALFPAYTTIYYDGCEVGAGNAGSTFLVACGMALLRGGGKVMGWTNSGYGMWGGWPLIGNHTVHNPFDGHLKVFHFAPGARIIPGSVVQKELDDDPFDPYAEVATLP